MPLVLKVVKLNKKIKVLIVCSLDGYANSVRPREIEKFLKKNNYDVKLLNTFNGNKNIIKSNIKNIIKRFIPKIIKSRKLIFDVVNKAKKLEKQILIEKPDVVICESGMDSYVLTKNLNCLKILDAASPWIDELYYGGMILKKHFEILRKIELEIYKKSDYLTFHWENYTKYVKKNIYDGKNIFIMNWGCIPKSKKAKYSHPPKIIFMGYLKGYWNNLPLLSKLSKKYDIDVYGGPIPDSSLGLNYKGYAPSTDILSEYQFGLITITKDELRKSSFSSKHLEYMSYGLPVLTPNWRQDDLLEEFSIKYDEDNFISQIEKYSSPKNWKMMSDKCYKQSKKWKWENQLKPLLKILNKHFLKK